LVPNSYKTSDKKNLGFWVKTQRQRYGSGNILGYEDRFLKLQSIGFSFRTLHYDSIHARWNRLFQRLVEYQQQHGDCLVPIDYPEDQTLGSWINTLRRDSDSLPEDQRAQLDSIGFVWNVLDANWYATFKELKRFQKQHCHLVVTKQHDADYPGLLHWVRQQRVYRDKMDKKRKEQLDSIGFVWDPFDFVWNEMFEKLERYRTKYGDCKVTQAHDDRKLVNWVLKQRYARDEMSSDRRQNWIPLVSFGRAGMN
jgi:hypothetical protein